MSHVTSSIIDRTNVWTPFTLKRFQKVLTQGCIHPNKPTNTPTCTQTFAYTHTHTHPQESSAHQPYSHVMKFHIIAHIDTGTHTQAGARPVGALARALRVGARVRACVHVRAHHMHAHVCARACVHACVCACACVHPSTISIHTRTCLHRTLCPNRRFFHTLSAITILNLIPHAFPCIYAHKNTHINKHKHTHVQKYPHSLNFQYSTPGHLKDSTYPYFHSSIIIIH